MNSKSRSGLRQKARQLVIAVLEHVVADESRLAATTRNFVWRVRGSPMQSMNRLFAEQGRQIDHWLSEVVGQARTFGLAVAGIKAEEPTSGTAADLISPQAVIRELLALHEMMAERLRGDVTALECDEEGGEATSLLTRLLEFHETTAWMLRLLLNTPEPVRVR